MWRAARTNRRGRSTDAHRAHLCALAMSTAPRRASHAPATSRAVAAERFRASCPANGRTELPSSGSQLFFGFVIFRDQPFQQPNAIPRAPALIDLGFRRAHRGSRDIEMRPGRTVNEPLQELRRGNRTTVASAGIFHVGELRIDLLVVFLAQRYA